MAHARADRALRASVDVAGERRRSVRRAAALVPVAARVADARPSRGRARAARRRGRADHARAVPQPGDRRDVVGNAGRRRRAGRGSRGRAAARAARGARPATSSRRGRSSGCTSARSRGRAGCCTRRTTSTWCACDAHEPRPTIDLAAEGVADYRWWTLDELERTSERLAPPDFLERVRTILSA